MDNICSVCLRPDDEHCSSCYCCPGTHDEYCGWGDNDEDIPGGAA